MLTNSIDGPRRPFVQTNVVGTFRLLESTKSYLAEDAGDKRDSFRFLHVSTDEVYGSLKPDEPAPSKPLHTPQTALTLLPKHRLII